MHLTPKSNLNLKQNIYIVFFQPSLFLRNGEPQSQIALVGRSYSKFHRKDNTSYLNFEHDPQAGWQGQSLPIWQSEKFSFVQYRVKVLHPVGVHVTVEYHPVTSAQLPTYVVNHVTKDGGE